MLELDEDFRKEYDELHDGDVDVTIKKFRRRRSLDANAYCWVLIDKLASVLGVPKETVYRDAIKQIGGVSEMVCVREIAFDTLKKAWESKGLGWMCDNVPSKLDGCVNAILYYGSSTYDTKQMSDLIDAIIQDCQAVGIETDTPEEIERIKSLWGTAPER